jgi:hypothetical protein
LALRLTKPKSHAEKIAQRDAAQKEGFLREVDEALREAEMIDAFKRYALAAGAAVVAGLLMLGGYLWWTAHHSAVLAQQAEQLVLALDKVDGGDQGGAFAQLAPLAQDGSAGNQAAARLMQAAIATRQGKPGQAEQIYASVAGDAKTPKSFRDLANLRYVALRFDTLPPAEIIARLRPLAAPGNPWFGSAGELVGVAYLREGRKDLAAPLFGAITNDPDVPESLRGRTRQLAGVLGFDAVQDMIGASAAAPGAPAAKP